LPPNNSLALPPTTDIAPPMGRISPEVTLSVIRAP
jgi:hypothetical protein